MSYLIILNYIYINFLIQTSNTKYVNFLVVAFSIFITFFIAFRYEVGGDWFTYRINYDLIADKNLFYSLKAYSSKIVVLIIYYTKNLTVFKETLILGILFCFFYLKYLISTKFFFLSAFITFPVFLILAGMGYVHQGVATVVCWQVLINYQKRSITEIVGYLIFATLIHLSALIFIFLLIPKLMKKENLIDEISNFLKKFFPYIILIAVLLVQFLNINPFEDLFVSVLTKFRYYLMDDYYRSDGAVIRMALYIPVIYILLKTNLNFFKNEKNVDLINLLKVSGLVMLSIIILSLLFRGSLNFAFVDRIFISMIFIQVLLTNNYYEQFKLKDNILLDILIYFLPLLYTFLWVNFSKYSTWWVPYNNFFIQ